MKPKHQRELFDLKTGFANSIVPGTYIAWASVSNMPNEIGLLWFRHVVRNRIEIINIYTMEIFRRRGVATRLLEDVCQAYPDYAVATESANVNSAPWLRANGFVKDDELGWIRAALK